MPRPPPARRSEGKRLEPWFRSMLAYWSTTQCSAVYTCLHPSIVTLVHPTSKQHNCPEQHEWHTTPAQARAGAAQRTAGRQLSCQGQKWPWLLDSTLLLELCSFPSLCSSTRKLEDTRPNTDEASTSKDGPAHYTTPTSSILVELRR